MTYYNTSDKKRKGGYPLISDTGGIAQQSYLLLSLRLQCDASCVGY